MKKIKQGSADAASSGKIMAKERLKEIAKTAYIGSAFLTDYQYDIWGYENERT